jgi:carbamate kinase
MARLVIAFGGNALIRERERGTWPEQLQHALEAARVIVGLSRADQVVLTHGNGPQVGALALQQAHGEPDAPALPLNVLGAMTQGEIGYLLQQALSTVDPWLPTATLLTRVVVADDDPAFAAPPTKPIGPFYGQQEALRTATERGWTMAEDAGRGWRRMVPSPAPLRVLEVDHVRRLLESGALVIAGGGGGIPVVWRDGALHGVDAVVDKDRCAAELALAVGADRLVLLTGVPRVALGFRTPEQREVRRLTVSDARRALGDGEFPAGSMGPKIEGAARFAAAGGQAIVTDIAHLAAAVRGEEGTWIVQDALGPSIVDPARVTA